MQNKQPFSKIIGIAGQIGSGKTTLSKELSNSSGFPFISIGSFVYNEALKLGYSTDRQSLQKLGTTLINKLGYKTFALSVLQEVDVNRSPIVIVDGLRHINVWKAFQSTSISSTLVYLNVSENKRLERVKNRDYIDIQSIQNSMNHSMELTVQYLIPIADLVLTEEPIDLMLLKVSNAINR